MLSNKNYEKSNIQFENILTTLNISFREYYDIQFLRYIKSFSQIIATYDIKSNLKDKIEDSSIEPIFLSAMMNIKNNDIYNYYRSRIATINVVRDKKLEIGKANLTLKPVGNSLYAEQINLPYYARKIDLLAFAHEMGHIPGFENKRRDISEYFEYTEVLPMLMEFFVCSYLFKGEEKEIFLKERLASEQNAAISFCQIYKKYNALSKKSSAKEKHLLYDLISCYKYLASLDFSLQLIDIMDNDKKEVINNLAQVVNGDSSINDVGKKFDIDTSCCKRLVKEYVKSL